MSSAVTAQHRRTHNLLLINKLLSCRDNSSPFTLVIDSLEQSGRPLIAEVIQRAKAGKVSVLYVSFETFTIPYGVNSFIDASRLATQTLIKDITTQLSNSSGRTLIVFDCLNHLAFSLPSLPQFLSSIITPNASLLACFHSDMPLPSNQSSYAPEILSLLTFLATTILTTYSLSHLLAQKSAQERSIAAPVFGLAEGIEGIIAGLGCNDSRGIVIDMEYRRKSGRGVKEVFWLPSNHGKLLDVDSARRKDRITLLNDHPLYKKMQHRPEENNEFDTTFNLSLTEKQRRDREGVVLPYFDAQRDEGVGEGGRILYDMGSEDDFDEEEDEI